MEIPDSLSTKPSSGGKDEFRVGILLMEHCDASVSKAIYVNEIVHTR